MAYQYLPLHSHGIKVPMAAVFSRRCIILFLITATTLIVILRLFGALLSPTFRLHDGLSSPENTTDPGDRLDTAYRGLFLESPLASDPPVTYESGGPRVNGGPGAGYTFLFLHALADEDASSARVWLNHVLVRGGLTGIRWVIPFAPKRRVTVRGGEEVPAWFDISNWEDLHQSEDEKGYQESSRALSELIGKEITQGTPMERMVFVGFSQGAVMSLLLTLTLHEPPAAIAILSAYLPLPSLLESIAIPSSPLSRTQLLWCHGADDPYLTEPKGRASFDLLTTGPNRIEWASAAYRVYQDVQHGWNDEEVDGVVGWLRRIVVGEGS